MKAALKVVDTNVVGTIALIHSVGRDMRAAGIGRILITSSIASMIPGTFQAVYNASKAFLQSFPFALRNELKDSGVSVTASGANNDKNDEPAMVAEVGFDAHLVFTGPIDKYFEYRYGRLPYRFLRFDHRMIDRARFQPVAVVNYPSPDASYVGITECKHLTGQRASRTSVSYDYPSDTGDPYYPIPRDEAQALYKRYEALALAAAEVTFVGGLATYRDYNMDKVVGQALAKYRRAKVAIESRDQSRMRHGMLTT